MITTGSKATAAIGCLLLLLTVYAHAQQTNQPKDGLLISDLRPRLFVRADDATVGRGLTLSALRLKLKDPAFSHCTDYNRDAAGFESLPAIAMQYLLKGDKKKALVVGEYLANTPFAFKEHTSSASAVYNSAIAFDWVRDALTQEMAAVITKKLVEGAEHLKSGVANPSINHNYTIVSLHGFAMVAVAIYGEGKENTERAREYLGLVKTTLSGNDMLLETLQAKQGTWGEGNHYTPFVVLYPMLMTLRGLTTATNTDYFADIRQRYDNFLEPMSKFLIANFRPDFTLERIGDVTGRVVPHQTFLRPLYDLLASEIRDTRLQGQVHSFSKEMSAYHGIELVPEINRWMLLTFYDSKLPDKPSYQTLPPVMRFGEGSYEHIMFRNSWKESGTQITYISGDHYTDHQHFDKGHFLIYKNGGLVIDGGGYSGMYAESWSNYSTRSLAHNSVLIYDSTEETKKGTSGTLIYPDGGQRVIRGRQSQKDWKTYVAEQREFALNTADVLAFDYDRVSNSYNYVKSDLTVAYGDKAKWVDRQLVYLPLADYLVIKDRVITAKPLDKYWTLHFEEGPQINGVTPRAGISEFPHDSIVYAQRSGALKLEAKTVQYGGGLFVKALLPAERTLSIIGGPGYEYFNRFANKNFPPEKPFLSNREAGNWRMDVSAVKPAAATAFINAFEITGSAKKTMVDVRYLKSTDGRMEGASFLAEKDPYLVFFSSSLDERGHVFQQTQLPVSYGVNTAAPTRHVLVELEPNKNINVYINEKLIGRFTTSAAGVLSFKDDGIGSRRIEIKAA